MQVEARAVFGNPGNSLILWGNAPKWQYSTAPLMTLLGDPVTPPTAGSGGLALQLNDQQVASLQVHPFTDTAEYAQA